MSADLLRLGIGYKFQAQRLGGVKRSTKSLLRQIAATPNEDRTTKPMPRKLTVGTRLVRDWHGVGHTVIVQIGSASCRERVCQSVSSSVVSVSLKKKRK